MEESQRSSVQIGTTGQRIALAIGTAGATEIAETIVDAGLEAGSKELEKASQEFWKKEDGKRAAMQCFRSALTDLAKDQKLVIVVDELDRCRPDYSLKLLEVIKHYFDVPNVHFVLGVNLQELENSVKARYGTGTNAAKYLQKFVTVSMPLVPRCIRGASTQLQMKHFQSVAEETGLSGSWKAEYLWRYLEMVDHHARLTLRDVEKIATLAMVAPEPRQSSALYLHFYCGLIVFQVLAPASVDAARNGDLSSSDVFRVLQLRNRSNESSFWDEAHIYWSLVTLGNGESAPSYISDAKQNFFKKESAQTVLRGVIAECLDAFQIIT